MSLMAESIPLTTSLCVNVDDIVEGNKAQRPEILESVGELLSSKPGLVNALHCPAWKVLVEDLIWTGKGKST